MRFFILCMLTFTLAVSHPIRYLIGRPPKSKASLKAPTPTPALTVSPSPSPSPTYGVVLDGPFVKLDARVPISSCPQFTTQYLQVINTSTNHLRIPHSRILTNGNPCGSLPLNATSEQLLSDSYMELIPIDHLLTSDIADEYKVLGAYKKLTSKRPYTFRFFQFLVDERRNAMEGPPPTYVGYERYKTRRCGDVELAIGSLVFFGTIQDVVVNLTGLVPRLQQGSVRRDLRLLPGKEFHVTFTPNGTKPEHVCPSVLRRTAIISIPPVRQCFPGGMRVISERGVIDVSDVEVGDRLFDGTEFSDVIMLTHRDRTTVTTFVEVVVDGFVVQASHGHLLLSAGGLVEAANVEEGMLLHTVHGMKVVTSVGLVRERGLFNMQTASGMVAVEGVITSCYTSAVPPFVAHALLTPVRELFSNRRVVSAVRSLAAQAFCCLRVCALAAFRKFSSIRVGEVMILVS